MSAVPQPGIERVVQSLADQVEADHGQQDGRARNGRDVPGGAQRIAPGADDAPPAHEATAVEQVRIDFSTYGRNLATNGYCT